MSEQVDSIVSSATRRYKNGEMLPEILIFSVFNLTSYTRHHDEDYLDIPGTASKGGKISLPNSLNLLFLSGKMKTPVAYNVYTRHLQQQEQIRKPIQLKK